LDNFLEILGVKAEKFKNYANELGALCKKNLYGSSSPLLDPTIEVKFTVSSTNKALKDI